MLGADELSLLKEEIISARQLVSEYQFHLGSIAVILTIRLYKRISGGDIEFWQSHFIKTPLQSQPFKPEKTRFTDMSVALQEAINGFTVSYTAAVALGLKPDESWLIPGG